MFKTIIKSTAALMVFGVLFSANCISSTPTETESAHIPGPHITPINYDSLYAQSTPPEYQPFEIYGWFLMGVATQKVPLVFNFKMPLPDHVIKTSDAVYKQIDDKKLGVDIYQPKDDTTPNPLILIIHGGYWKAGDKGIHLQNAVEFADLGYTVASVNYRHSTEAKFPAAIEDIRDAIIYLTENAAQYNIDPSQITTYGGSAGGHLSAFMGLSANSEGKDYVKGINPDSIKGIISLYGIHDLTLPIQREHPFTELFIGKSYADDPSAYLDASPIAHVDKNDPPVLLTHGALDGSVSVQNSDVLSEMLNNAQVPVTYDRVKGWPHAMDFFSPIGERTLWHIHKFLKKNMPSDELKATQ